MKNDQNVIGYQNKKKMVFGNDVYIDNLYPFRPEVGRFIIIVCIVRNLEKIS